MNTKKALAGLSLSLSLAGGIVASASAALAIDETTAVAPAAGVVTEAPVVAAPVVAETPVVETAPPTETITVYIEHVQYGVGMMFYHEYTLNPGESITDYAVDFGGELIPDVQSLTITYEQAKQNNLYRIVYRDATTTVTTEATTTTASSEPTTTTVTTEATTTTASPEPKTTTVTTEATTTTSSPEPTTTTVTTEATTTTASPEPTTTTETTTTEVPTTEAPTTEAPTTEAPSTVQISFHLDGGTLQGQTGTVTLEARVGDVITLPEAPTREGYKFLYWKGSVYQPGANYTVTGPKTFTAVWEPVAKQATTTTSASETPQKILPATGDPGSLLSLVGLGVAGFAGLLGLKRPRKN